MTSVSVWYRHRGARIWCRTEMRLHAFRCSNLPSSFSSLVSVAMFDVCTLCLLASSLSHSSRCWLWPETVCARHLAARRSWRPAPACWTAQCAQITTRLCTCAGTCTPRTTASLSAQTPGDISARVPTSSPAPRAREAQSTAWQTRVVSGVQVLTRVAGLFFPS